MKERIAMKSTEYVLLTVLMLAALLAGAWAQTSDSTAPAPREKQQPSATAPAITATDFQSLKDAFAAQQRQIQELSLQLAPTQQDGRRAQAAAADAASKAAAAQSQASQVQQTVSELADLKTVNTATPNISVPNNAALKNAVQ